MTHAAHHTPPAHLVDPGVDARVAPGMDARMDARVAPGVAPGVVGGAG